MRAAEATTAGFGAAAAGAATGVGAGFGAPATAAAAMIRIRSLRMVAASTTGLRQIFRKPHIRAVAGATQLARFGALLHGASRLVQMRAIVETAVLARFGKFREVVAQRFQRQVPQTELADAGRVDQIGAAAEVVKGGGGGGVAAGGAFVQLAGGDVEALIERIQDRRLADAAMADQRAGFAFDESAQFGDALV